MRLYDNQHRNETELINKPSIKNSVAPYYNSQYRNETELINKPSLKNSVAPYHDSQHRNEITHERASIGTRLGLINIILKK